MTAAQTLASRFLEALNGRDFRAMEALLDEDAALDSMTGLRTIGLQPLRIAIATYFRHFDESFADIVIMTDAVGQRVAADVTARGTYRETMAGFPPANGQTYAIPSVFVFEVEDGQITRVSHYRNVRVFEQALRG